MTITVDGTIGFIPVRRDLRGSDRGRDLPRDPAAAPARWARRARVFGAGLLVVLGTNVEPLRGDNPDFDIVGPGWFSVLVFTALALAFGVVLAGFMVPA